VAGRFGAHENQLADMRRVPSSICEGNYAGKRCAVQDRFLDCERVIECLQVVNTYRHVNVAVCGSDYRALKGRTGNLKPRMQ
jgi:hypothetical protein